MMDATIASDEESDDGDADAVSNGANARSPTTANASPTKSPLSETALEERASRVAVQLDACSSSSDESVRQRMEADDPRMEADDEMAMGGVPVVAAAAVSRPGTTTTHAAGSTNEVQEQTDKRDSE